MKKKISLLLKERYEDAACRSGYYISSSDEKGGMFI